MCSRMVEPEMTRSDNGALITPEPGIGSTPLGQSRSRSAAFSRQWIAISGLLRGSKLRLPGHGDITRLFGDSRKPSPDRGKAAEVEVALIGDMGVGVKRDVGDREMICDEKAMPCQVRLHHAERAITVFHPVLERMALQFAAALDQSEPEIGRADIRLEAVLLEKHPLQRFRTPDAVFRRQH